MRNNTEDRPSSGPFDLERTLTLTDAVVAIAMTLLILPLVDVSGEVVTGRLGDRLVEYSDLVTSFVVSFLVIYVFWAAHGEALGRLDQRDAAGIRSLTMWWLLVIAFLPFPTAVLGREVNTSSAPFYIGTMTLLSLLTSAISAVVDRAVPDRRRGWISWLTTLVFLVCALVSTINARLGLLGLLALVLVRLIEVRMARGADAGDRGLQATAPSP